MLVYSDFMESFLSQSSFPDFKLMEFERHKTTNKVKLYEKIKKFTLTEFGPTLECTVTGNCFPLKVVTLNLGPHKASASVTFCV